MLGDRYLVAPVLVQGAVTRDVYLPAGTWLALDDPGEVHVGPVTLADYPAPIERLPAFVLQTP
jgi:alpha-glucosidase (family GH31 glycosyl hydrolase)